MLGPWVIARRVRAVDRVTITCRERARQCTYVDTVRASPRARTPCAPRQERACHAMHASTCALQGALTGASTCVSGPLSGGRHVPCSLLPSRPRCHRVCVITAAAHSSPAAGDDTPAAVPRRLVLASPPALLLAVATAAALQPGSAAAASRRLKAPPVDQYLTLPVRAVPRLLACVLRLRQSLTRTKHTTSLAFQSQ